MNHRFCDNCGKRRSCFKTWLYGRWEWWCQPCLDEEEDGYVIRL